MRPIYFDYASTTPADPQVVESMRPFFHEQFGNASSPHVTGQRARKSLEDARMTVAECLGARSEEIVFTSGGSESNNHAILGAARAGGRKGGRILVSAVEHHSVQRPAEALAGEGFRIARIPVDRDGLVDPSAAEDLIDERTVLISVMHANNEIGVIQPVAEIGRMARERGILFHVDAVQTAGHVPVDVREIRCDLLSISGHKFYGPPGTGALYVRQGVEIAPLIRGGDQERGRRASTPNLPGIVGMAKALDLGRDRMPEEAALQTQFRDRIISSLLEGIPGSRLNGHPQQRLPNNAHFSFEGVDGEALLLSLDMAGISASMGSACTSGSMEASHVLRAIGLDEELAHGSLRISLGRWTTGEDTQYLIDQLPAIVRRLRSV